MFNYCGLCDGACQGHVFTTTDDAEDAEAREVAEEAAYFANGGK